MILREQPTQTTDTEARTDTDRPDQTFQGNLGKEDTCTDLLNDNNIDDLGLNLLGFDNQIETPKYEAPKCGVCQGYGDKAEECANNRRSVGTTPTGTPGRPQPSAPAAGN